MSDATDPYPLRKRAPKACLKCRARKVRCDVTRAGQPCTNCRLDDRECAVVARTKGKFRHMAVGHEQSDTIRWKGMKRPPEKTKRCHTPPGDILQVQTDQDDDSRLLETLKATSPVTQRLAENPAQADQYDLFDNSVAPCVSWVEDEKSSPLPWDDVSSSCARRGDLRFLEEQGCFRLPSSLILAEFLDQYFLHVHPMLPMLSEHEVWARGAAFDGMTGTQLAEKLPMALIQAILFSACPFVSHDTIGVLGYQDVNAAKVSFYNRAKLLHDFNIEPDHETMAQAALLLTYWTPTVPDEPEQPNSRWLRIAIEHARDAGAPDYTKTGHAERDRGNRLKRLWWCCVIRDRIMPLCVRRTIQITREIFDFGGNIQLDCEDLADETESSRVYSPEMKRALGCILGSLADLCVTLTDVLSLVYPGEPLGPTDVPFENSFQGLNPRRALDTWMNRATAELPSPATPRTSLLMGPGETGLAESLFTDLLWMYYYAAQVALCNHDITQRIMSPHSSDGHRMLGSKHTITAKTELSKATAAIIGILERLMDGQLSKGFPSSVVGCAALPFALHVLGSKVQSSVPEAADKTGLSICSALERQRRLEVLMRALKECHVRYDGVEWISQAIQSFLQNMVIPGSPSSDENHASPDGTDFSDWSDIFDSRPELYLRMSITIDMSLSQGRLPEEEDFPLPLRQGTGAQYEVDNALGVLDGDMSHLFRDPVTSSLSGWIENDRSLYFLYELGTDGGLAM